MHTMRPKEMSCSLFAKRQTACFQCFGSMAAMMVMMLMQKRRWARRQGAATAAAAAVDATTSLLFLWCTTLTMILLLVLPVVSVTTTTTIVNNPNDLEHLPMDQATHDAWAATWDSWHSFSKHDGQGEDDAHNNHPTSPHTSSDYCGEFDPIHRDIPTNNFPNKAWQVDMAFVNHLLSEGGKLVSRAQEAILTEYGHGKKEGVNGDEQQDEQRLRRHMFHWEKIVDLSTITTSPEGFERGGGKRPTGGWTTNRSWNGLVRRLLHAIITNDEFVVVLGGHSAAAGHGNHFHQSYIMAFHRILSPILARLGVKLRTHNMAQGGLGTLQSSMGSRDLYGTGIDLLLWDSGMTEAWPSHKDFFLRQALLSGTTKIPVIWAGAGMDFDVLKYLHEQADIDIGQYGLGLDGIITVTSPEQALSDVPYASRYMKCAPELKPDLCDSIRGAPRFCSTCWINRDDIPTSRAQELFPNLLDKPHSQVKWHPGWRVHQLQGRVLAMAVLDALHDALQIWRNHGIGTAGGTLLDDADWHVTEYYQNMRTKLQALGQREEQAQQQQQEGRGACWEMQNQGLPGRICTTAMHGATQHTPRLNPTETSLIKLIRPAVNGYKPQNLQHMQYEGPDVHNPCFDLEEGAIDVVAIVSGRRRHRQRQRQLQSSSSSSSSWQEEEDYMPRLFRQLHESRQARVQHEKQAVAALSSSATLPSRTNRNLRAGSNSRRRRLVLVDDEKIEPGIGWQVEGELPGTCDGSYYTICGREESNTCPLLGHHDGRGQVVGNEYSGWLVFDLPAVEKGLIIMKLFTGNPQQANRVTDGWTSVNNRDGSATRRRRQLSSNNTNETTAATIMTSTSSTSNGSQGNTSNDTEDEVSFYMDNMYDHHHSHDQQQQQQDQRSLAGKPLLASHILPDDTFAFDFAINGKITTWNKQEFLEHKKDVQRTVEAYTLLDDPNFIPNGQPPRSVELAIRMRGCGRHCTFGVTHLYWA